MMIMFCFLLLVSGSSFTVAVYFDFFSGVPQPNRWHSDLSKTGYMYLVSLVTGFMAFGIASGACDEDESDNAKGEQNQTPQ